MVMKEELEEVLDSLIAAHRIEAPDCKIFRYRPLYWIRKWNGTKMLLYLSLVIIVIAGMVTVPENITITSSVNGGALPIYSVETDKMQVALTFNIAVVNRNSNETSNLNEISILNENNALGEILDVLEMYQVRATFFAGREWIESSPENVEAILAAGHDLGSRGDNTEKGRKQSLMKIHNKVKTLTGYQMFLYRPSSQQYDSEELQAVTNSGCYTIGWSIDSQDWKNYGAEYIMNTVCENDKLRSGSIVLFHTDTENTAGALKTIISNLEGKGYEIIPVSELIYKKDYYVDQEGRQIKNNG